MKLTNIEEIEKKAAEIPTNRADAVMQNSTPIRMLLACFLGCILGIVIMAWTGHYYMVGTYICILMCIFITTPLLASEKISVDTACIAPMVILCFVYTPISWFTFDGLLGSTPYLSILFFAIITLVHYRWAQKPLLFLYGATMLGLVVHWLITWQGAWDLAQIINILLAYVVTVALIINIFEAVKNKSMQANKRIEDLSMRDELTGLLNRRAIVKELDRLEADFTSGNHEYVMIMMDINRFKIINDLYGHGMGDIALKNAAACIRQSVRGADQAFRFGGDEFLLLLPQANERVAQQVCARIDKALRSIQGYAFEITVSAGHALRSECVDHASVLALADQRMYEVKRGKSRQEDMRSEAENA